MCRRLESGIIALALLLAAAPGPTTNSDSSEAGSLEPLQVSILAGGLSAGQYFISCEVSNPNQTPVRIRRKHRKGGVVPG